MQRNVKVSELASQLGVSGQTIRNAIRKNVLSAAQIVPRGRFLIRPDDAASLIRKVQGDGSDD